MAREQAGDPSTPARAPDGTLAALTRVGTQLGIGSEAVRKWVREAGQGRQLPSAEQQGGSVHPAAGRSSS